jgi:hypothetical protein
MSESEGVRNVHGMLRYCNEVGICRRRLMQKYFGSEIGDVPASSISIRSLNQWTIDGDEHDICRNQCDACTTASSIRQTDMTRHAYTICQCIQMLRNVDEKLTFRQLVDVWNGRQTGVRVKSILEQLNESNDPLLAFPCNKTINAEDQERFVIFLILESLIEDEFHYTPYSTISYLRLTRKGKQLLQACTEERARLVLGSVSMFTLLDEKTDKKRNAESHGWPSRKRVAIESPGAQEVDEEKLVAQPVIDLTDEIEFTEVGGEDGADEDHWEYSMV